MESPLRLCDFRLIRSIPVSIPLDIRVYSGIDTGMVNIDTIKITTQLLALLSELDEFKGAWRALGTIAPKRLSALKRIATIESIGSSTRIEGSKLTDREVEQLLGRLDSKAFKSRDEEEVAGYAEVMETVFQSWADLRLTENHLKQLHRDLLRHSAKDERHRGEYKTLRNDVGAFDENGTMIGVVFETATPFDTPRRMTELLTWLEDATANKTLHPLLIVAVFIVVFLAIHPFQDGNGRLSRILTTLLLLQAGYSYVPYSSLESVIENSKEGYYLALRQTQGTLNADTPDWQPWLLFFMRALQQQMRTLAQKVERERSAVELSNLAVKILDYARMQGRVTTRDMVREHGASANTLKSTFGTLVEKGLLVRQGGGRSTWYRLP
jgi:Fic family protein